MIKYFRLIFADEAAVAGNLDWLLDPFVEDYSQDYWLAALTDLFVILYYEQLGSGSRKHCPVADSGMQLLQEDSKVG
jgi:hypothetical protein